MPNFAEARRMMVDGQVRTGDVTNLRLLSALLDLPREYFVPSDKADIAYLDRDIVVTPAGKPVRKLLKPLVLAKLIDAAEIRESDHVLDIGCASGYSAAVLGRLAASVVALEEDSDLANAAKNTLATLGCHNINVVSGPLTEGWPASGPYDVIVMAGATQVPPDGLRGQLMNGGRLVCVLQSGPVVGNAMVYRSLEGELSGRPIFDAAAPLLPGFARKPEFVF